MTVTVLIPGVLRADAGGESHLELDAAGAGGADTLGTVLDEMAERWPRLERRIRDERGELRRYVNVYVNGEDCRGLSGQQTPVPAGAEIQVIPSVAGG
jgi:sulfur-carrier protein